jgi:hypothetical protein
MEQISVKKNIRFLPHRKKRDQEEREAVIMADGAWRLRGKKRPV